MAFTSPARRILVIKTRAIGDTVLLSGTLRVLRAQKPYYKIDVLVENRVGSPAGSEGTAVIGVVVQVVIRHGVNHFTGNLRAARVIEKDRRAAAIGRR